MDAKQQHLSFIQAVITRLSTQSFLVKGWGVTLAVALLALAANRNSPGYAAVSSCPFLVFWILDGFFLSRERAFRSLYDDVRRKEGAVIDFSMDIRPFRTGRNSWLCSAFSRTLLPLYGLLLASAGGTFVWAVVGC
jgi:hypothetical protein